MDVWGQHQGLRWLWLHIGRRRCLHSLFSRRVGRVANTKTKRVSIGRRLILFDYTRMYDVLHLHGAARPCRLRSCMMCCACMCAARPCRSTGNPAWKSVMSRNSRCPLAALCHPGLCEKSRRSPLAISHRHGFIQPWRST